MVTILINYCLFYLRRLTIFLHVTFILQQFLHWFRWKQPQIKIKCLVLTFNPLPDRNLLSFIFYCLFFQIVGEDCLLPNCLLLFAAKQVFGNCLLLFAIVCQIVWFVIFSNCLLPNTSRIAKHGLRWGHGGEWCSASCCCRYCFFGRRHSKGRNDARDKYRYNKQSEKISSKKKKFQKTVRQGNKSWKLTFYYGLGLFPSESVQKMLQNEGQMKETC